MYGQSNSSSKSNTSSRSNHANFIEALKSVGSAVTTDVVKGIKNDVLGGTVNQFGETIFGEPNSNNNDSQNQAHRENFDFSEFMRSSELRTKAQERVKYEYEQREVVIFNRRQDEVKKKIDQIRVEIKKLAAEIVQLDSSARVAIQQEIVDPGTYHLSFFEKLLIFVRQLRKRVTQSRHWASLHGQRSQAKSYYWQQANAKVGGTKFMLSQERQVVTQTG